MQRLHRSGLALPGAGSRKQCGLVGAVLCATMIVWGAADLAAQSRPADTTLYTFVAVDVSLGEAIDRFIDQTGINVAFEIDLIEGKRTYCRAVEKTVDEVFRCLLEGTELDFIRLSTGTYVVKEHVKSPPQWGDLTGRIVDSESGEPLPNAHVLLADAGDVTNDAGRFSFGRLKPGLHRIVVTYVGYRDAVDTVQVAPNANTMVELGLQAEPVVSSPIIINGLTRRLPSETIESDIVDAADLAEEPGSGDVIRSLNTIVGVRVGDTTADVHVQGGDAGELQYRLDGVPVFIPIPNGGIIGPFSPFALEKFTVHKAGYGAVEGSQLSGVIDAEHRLSPMVGQSFDVQVDPLSVNGRAMGRFGGSEGVEANWMVSARKALWSIYRPRGLSDHFSRWSQPDLFLINALTNQKERKFEHAGASLSNDFRDGGFQDHFDFYDLHAATRLRMGPLQSLYASFYVGGNTLGDEEVIEGRPALPFAGDDDDESDLLSFNNEYAWTNVIGSLSYERILGNRTFAEWTLWYSGFNLRQHFDQEDYEDHHEHERPRPDSLRGGYSPFSADSLARLGFSTDDTNRMAEYGLRTEINHAFGSRHFFTGGIEGIRSGNDFLLDLQLPRGEARTTPVRAQIETRHWRLAGYAEDRIELGANTSLTAGLRLTYLNNHPNLYAEPRLAFRHDADKGPLGAWAFRGAVGLYRQFVNQFDVTSLNVNAVLPGVRFWMPLGESLAPSKAFHASGAFLLMPDPSWKARLEGYYKWQPHTYTIDYANPAFVEGNDTLISAQDELLTVARGFAYGGAISLEKKQEYWSASAQYEYSVAEQRIDNRFGGNYVTVPWNVPHRISASFDFSASDHLTLLGRIQYSIGRAWAFRDAYYNYLEPSAAYRVFGPYDLSDPASHRLPVVTQLDLGVAYARRLKGMSVQVRLDVANALSATNVEEWNLFFNPETGQYIKVERPLSPLLPSITMRLGW